MKNKPDLMIPARRQALTLPLAISLALAGGLHAAEWNTDAAANWNNNANWTNPATFPNAAGAVADFSTLDITGNHIITLGQNITVGSIILGDTNGSNGYTIGANANTFTMDVSSGSAAITQNSTSGTNTFNQVINLNDNLSITNSALNSNLNFNQAISGTNRTVTVDGVGTGDYNGNLVSFNGANTFAKLVIDSGIVNAQSNLGNDTNLGAVPASFTADALTLDGGVLRRGGGSALTIHANRGITLGSNGGTLNAASSVRLITVDSVITGSGSLTIYGGDGTYGAGRGGIVTLNKANDYTGGTFVNSGTLKFAKLVSQPATGVVAVTGGTLAVNLGGTGEWTMGTSGNGTIGGLLAGLGGQSGGTVTYTGNVALGFDTSNAASTLTYGAIGNDVGTTLGLTKLGTGTLELDGANTYSGSTTVSGGTLSGIQTSGTPFGTGALTVGPGALSIAPGGSGSAISLAGGTVAADTLFTYNAGATLSLARGSQTSLTYTFGGTGATTARGTNGTLILSTSDIANFGTVGGKTEKFIMNGTAPTLVNNLVSGVVIQDRNSSNKGDFATYDSTDGFTRAAYTHTNSFTSPGTTTNTSVVNITSNTSTGASRAAYALRVDNATLSLTSGKTLTLGGTSTSGVAQLILNNGRIAAGTLTVTNPGSPGTELTIYTSGASSIQSNINTATNMTGVSVFGPGTLTLENTNSFTGGLRIINSTVIASAPAQTGPNGATVALIGGTLQITSSHSTGGNRAITLSAGQNGSGGTISVNTGVTYTYQNSSTNSQIMSGSGSLTKTGAGTLVFSGNTTNTYTGGTFINQGTLQLGLANIIPDSGALTVGGGTLDIVTYNDTVGAVTLTSGSITGTTGVLTGSSYAVESGSVSAKLGGSVALTKSTAGTVTLSGANTYTGGTTINAGTLALGASDTLANAGAVAVDGATAILSIGTNSDTVGAVSLKNGAQITGTGGTLTGSSYAVESGSVSAKLGGSAALTKTTAGTVTLSGANTYTGATNVNAGTLVITGATQATNAITFGGGVLGLDTGSSVTATSATVDFTGQQVLVTGPTGAPSYTLLTASSITGTPTLAAGSVSGYTPQVSGNQLLLVQTGGSPYGTWADNKGLTGANNAKTDDPDNDGRNNLGEFAFNGDPLSGSDNGKFFVLTEDSDSDGDADKELILTVAVRSSTPAFSGSPSPTAAHPTDGITYTIEGSLDLAGFPTTVNMVPTPVTTGLPPAGDGYEYRSFSLSGSNGLPGRGFLRAKVTSP